LEKKKNTKKLSGLGSLGGGWHVKESMGKKDHRSGRIKSQGKRGKDGKIRIEQEVNRGTTTWKVFEKVAEAHLESYDQGE